MLISFGNFFGSFKLEKYFIALFANVFAIVFCFMLNYTSAILSGKKRFDIVSGCLVKINFVTYVVSVFINKFSAEKFFFKKPWNEIFISFPEIYFD